MVNFRCAIVAVVLVSACNADPVVWQKDVASDAERPSPLAFPAPQAIDPGLADTNPRSAFGYAQDLLREAGATSMLSDAIRTMPEFAANAQADSNAVAPMMHDMARMSTNIGTDLGTGKAPIDTARCTRSLRSVAVAHVGRVAVWWSRRNANRVFLVAAWRFGDDNDSTVSWRGPIMIDTVDRGPADANSEERGATGCVRAAPGVAVGAHNYVHVSYALNAAEGPGVFYAHQMDPRSGFEPPQVIVYGDYLGTTRVAADGERVAVVYEDPNSMSRTQIGVAISNSSGHGFVNRITASSSSSAARDPYVVLRGNALVVGWSDLPSSTSEPATFRLRRGVLR